MSIFQGSRYEYSVVDFVAIKEDSDANAIVFYEFSPLGSFSYREHTYIKNERLDVISYDYYQRPDFWWLILDANPQIEDPLNIEPGTVLRIPLV